jgi:cation diffusion facilitator CzcD-associated flavoprotein CzcO
VTAAHYQEEAHSWDVTLEDGRHYGARYLITAIGMLSAQTMPRIAGVDTFKGQSCHTHYWPKEPVSFDGKRGSGDRHRRHCRTKRSRKWPRPSAS